MRIAFVADTFDEASGGGVVSARRFVEALRTRHEVTVLATGQPAPGKVVLPGLQLPVHAMQANHFTFAMPHTQTLYEVLAEQDIVHVNFPFLAGYAAVRIARQLSVPVVTAFHVQPENLLFNVGIHSQTLNDWLYRRWVHGFYGQSDAVIAPSDFAGQLLRDHGLQKPVFTISNGAPQVHPEQERKAEPHDRPFLVLCSGRLAAEKRPDLVVEAVARSRHRESIRLVLAGHGPLDHKLTARAKELNLPLQLGFVSDLELASLRANADLAVHASEVELEGMAVLEAMAAGLPVLIADSPTSAAKEFAAGPDFLFRAGHADHLAAQLDHLLESPQRRAAASRWGLQVASGKRLGESAALLEEAYLSVITAHARLRLGVQGPIASGIA